MRTKHLIRLIVSVFTTISFSLQAEDGGALFKSRCNTCHQIDKNSTGPKLKGVKQKWTDAGEGDLLYQWVMNSTTLISTGKSAMANEIQNFSPTAMPAQDVTKDQIDAIFNYIDTYQPPVAVSDTSSVTGSALSAEVKPDYNYNLTIFNWMLFLTFILVVVIIVLSGSIITLVKSDYFKTKVAEKNKLNTILILILTTGSMLLSNNTFALDFMQAGEAEKGTPWLLVESMDLYGLLTIDIVLMIVVLYLRNLFNQMIAMTKTEKEVAVEEKSVAFKKINTILTDAVPIEEEHTILLEHEYDGIQELDNNLPPWWVWGFFATIVFAFIYLINYHVLGVSDLQDEQYKKEMVTAKKEIDAYLSEMAMNVDESNATIMTDKGDLSQGKSLFETNCASCHKSTGEGDVGPNLTDDHWIYGYDIKEVFATIKKGRPNGMPEHASKLNPIQIQQVSSYVLSLPFVKGNKEPQGAIIEK